MVWDGTVWKMLVSYLSLFKCMSVLSGMHAIDHRQE